MIIIKFSSIILIIFIILLFIIRRRKKNKLRKKILSEGSGYSFTAKNIANSISKSKNLYKELIIKVHPDKFDNSIQKEATELSSRITKSKHNYNDLLSLKNEVDEFLSNNSV